MVDPKSYQYFALLLDALRSTDPTPTRPAQAVAWIRARVDVPADDLTRFIRMESNRSSKTRSTGRAGSYLRLV